MLLLLLLLFSFSFFFFLFQSTTECDSADVVHKCVQFNVIVGCDCLLSSIVQNAFALCVDFILFLCWFHQNAFLFNSIEFWWEDGKRKKHQRTLYRCIGIELMLILEIFSFEIYILNGKSENHPNIHTRSEHTLCDWSVMECSGVRVEMWWNYCSIEWFMPFFMCILCNVSYFFYHLLDVMFVSS